MGNLVLDLGAVRLGHDLPVHRREVEQHALGCPGPQGLDEAAGERALPAPRQARDPDDPAHQNFSHRTLLRSMPLPIRTLPHPADDPRPAAHVGDQPVDAVDEPVHGLVGLAPSRRASRPAPLSAPGSTRTTGSGGPGSGSRGSYSSPPAGGSPVDERVRPPVTRFVEVEEDGADGHDADLLGNEQRPTGIGAIHREAAGRALEPDRGARRRAPGSTGTRSRPGPRRPTR